MIYLVLIGITMAIFDDWFYAWEYFIFPASFVAGFGLSFVLERMKASFRMVQNICIAYCMIFMLATIMISVFPFPDAPASLIFVSFMVLSMAFILPSTTLIGVMLLSEVLFIVLVTVFKHSSYWAFDVFTSLASCIISIALTEIICSLTVSNNLVKMKYKMLCLKDELTGLYNKSAFEYECKFFLQQDSGTVNALIMIDIDDFKKINDQHGHEIGDEVLEIIGKCISETFRSEDIAGRFGGDEYLILMKNVPGVSVIEERLRTFRSLLANMKLEHMQIEVSCSIGALLAESNRVYYEEWLRMADVLMYHVKKNGKNNQMILWRSEFVQRFRVKELMLVVEDELSGRQILSRIFQEEYEIILAKDGLEAKEQIKKYGRQISIVLLDLIMPNLSGQEVLKWMKLHETYENIPVVVLTSDQTAELDVLELGVEDMVVKPYDARILKARVKNAIQKAV